jgi:hypothetical protein
MQEEVNMLEDLIEQLTAVRSDYDKFYSDGNSAAGTRVRKVMQEVKNAAQELLIDIQNTKNS